MNLLQKKWCLAICLIFCTGIFSFAQQTDHSATLSKIESKINNLKSEKENIERLMYEISSDEKVYTNAVTDGTWNKYLQSKKAIVDQITEWETTRKNILSNTEVSVTEKIKVTRTEFNALPEANQKAILSEPNRFEIVEQ